MEFGRSNAVGAAAAPQQMYSIGRGISKGAFMVAEERDGFELEQTAMAALQNLEGMDGGQIPDRDWARHQFELSPSATSFELRQFGNNSAPYSMQPSHVQMGRRQPASQMNQQMALPANSSPANKQLQNSRHPTKPTHLPATAVERNDFREVADFILQSKGGNEAAALDFLRNVFLVINSQNPSDTVSAETHDWDSAVRNGPPYLTPEDQAAAQAQLVMNQHNSILLHAQRTGIPPRPPPVVPITLFGDEIDQRLSTLVILVPGRAHIVGHLIGKGGAEVGKIERELSVTVKIEAATKLGIQLVERSVCIIGTVASTTLAQQLVSNKVHEKLLSEGVQAEVLKMVVPNEIVRHLIGKNGANINRLQNESGARIQVEPETTMPTGSFGRTIVLQGAERCRTFAQYLILRQIAEDRNVHSDWAGRAHSSSGPGSPPSAPLPPASPPPTQMMGAHNLSSPLTGPTMRATATWPTAAPVAEDIVEFSVPEAAVAFLIGRNGASISEVQNQTGARVHIARVGPGAGVTDRRVAVSGPPRAVEAAQQLIKSRVQLAVNGNASPQHVRPQYSPHAQQ